MCHRVPGRQRQHERYRPKLYQRIYGSQPVFCTSHQSVFPQCVTTEFLWISTVWNYQHGKYRHDSTGGIDIGSSVGNGRSDCTDILCDHDGICSDKSIFGNLKRGGILVIQIAVGSLYMFSVPRGYIDGFTQWCKQVIGICLTAFCRQPY